MGLPALNTAVNALGNRDILTKVFFRLCPNPVSM
jgi:hypothetical protein